MVLCSSCLASHLSYQTPPPIVCPHPSTHPDHLYEATLGFWVIFCLLYLVTMSAIAIKAYTLGAVKCDVWVLWNTGAAHCTPNCTALNCTEHCTVHTQLHCTELHWTLPSPPLLPGVAPRLQ